MEQFLENTHHLMGTTISLVATIIEIWGIFLIVLTVAKEVYRTIVVYHFDFQRISIDETMNHGLASALEILLAAEILKTLTISTPQQLLIIAALVVIRIFIGLILHYELKQKSHHLEIEHQQIQIEKEKNNL